MDHGRYLVRLRGDDGIGIATSATLHGMIEMTPTGFRIVLAGDGDSPMLLRFKSGYVNLVSDVWRFISGATTLRPGGAQRFLKVFRLMILSGRYYEEMERCKRAEAEFARTVLGASLLECLFLLACVRDRHRVTITQSWKAFVAKRKRTKKLFSEAFDQLDLNTLILIAKELGWLPDDVSFTRSVLSAYGAPEEQLEALSVLLVSPLAAATQIREARNHLHPGNCLRSNFSFDKKKEIVISGEEVSEHLTQYLLFLCISCMLDRFSLPPNAQLDFEIPEPIRAVFNKAGMHFTAESTSGDPHVVAGWIAGQIAADGEPERWPEGWSPGSVEDEDV